MVAAGSQRRTLLVLIVPVLAALLLTSCVKTGSAQPHTGLLDADEGEAGNRTDCEEMYGTAFRSDEERAWFNGHCARWPLVNVPEYRSAPASANASLPQECNEMRGRPYSSDEQRRWYLANCLDDNEGDSSTAGSQVQSGDRTNCDEILGTPYRSTAERAWYLINCGQASTDSGSTSTQRSRGDDGNRDDNDDRGGGNNRGRGRD